MAAVFLSLNMSVPYQEPNGQFPGPCSFAGEMTILMADFRGQGLVKEQLKKINQIFKNYIGILYILN